MLLTRLDDEPLIHVLHFLHGRDVCKLELTCRRFRQLSFTYDNVAWKNKCRILWESKIRTLVRMHEDIVLPIGFFDIRNSSKLDDLFEKTHVPLHEKVPAFREVFNMKDSNNLMDKIKKFPKRRKLEAGVSSEDRLKLDPSWKTLYSLDYLTDKFHGKYRKKKGPKLYLSPMPLYSPFTVPKNALPMPKIRGPNFQSNRFWGVGNADEIYYIIKDRPEPRRNRTNSLTSSGENTLRGFFGRGRSNSVSGECKTNTTENNTSKLSSSTDSLPNLHSTRTQPTNSQSTRKPQITKTINTTTTSQTDTTHRHNHTHTHTLTTTTTTTTTTTKNSLSSSSTSTSSSFSSSAPSSSSSTHSKKHPLSSSTSQTEPPPTDRNLFDKAMLLPLGQLYFENRPNGSIDTVGGVWTVIQTKKGRMLVLWRIWRLVCYAEPLMPTKLAYEWLPTTPQVQPTSYLDLHYDMMGPWHSGKVVAEKLWKMRPWYDQAE